MPTSVTEGAVNDLFHTSIVQTFQAVLEDMKPVWTDYLEMRTTEKRFFDDVEVVDPGLWTELDEGNDVDLDEFSQGMVIRYRPINFAKRLVIPEYIEDDIAFEEAIDASAMMARTFVQTEDVVAVGIIDDAANAGVVGGDGVPLASAAHVIKGGSTVSNILNPAILPSNRAVQLLLVAAEKMVGGNGQIASVRVMKVWGPTDQKFRFKEILKSTQKDDTANNAINSLKGELSDQPVSIPHMASTTNWGVRTNVMKGASFVWRQRPRMRSEKSLKNLSTVWVGDARFLVNWSNWRTFFFSLA